MHWALSLRFGQASRKEEHYTVYLSTVVVTWGIARMVYMPDSCCASCSRVQVIVGLVVQSFAKPQTVG
jgi:hypothetical protein